MGTPSRPLPTNQPDFERAVMQSIMRRNPDCADVLAEQFRVAEITERRGTGAGCYIDFSVPDSAPRLADHTEYPLSSDLYLLKSSDAQDILDLPTFSAPADFRSSVVCGAILAHNQRGLITHLDCHSYGAGSWPEEVYDMWFEVPGVSN